MNDTAANETDVASVLTRGRAQVQALKGNWAACLFYMLPVLALTGLSVARAGFPLDDSYMTQYNARTLIAGGAIQSTKAALP